MQYVGIALHKQIMVLCVVHFQAGKREVSRRRQLACRDVESIRTFFVGLGP
jgi:hypothetical protein